MPVALLLLFLAGCSTALELPSSSEGDEPELVVVVRGTTVGRVTSQPAGIDCPGTCAARFSGPVTLTATGEGTTTWRGVDCVDGRICRAPAAGRVVAGFYQPGNVLFVSSIERAAGSFGGLAGVDAACAALADAAGLPGEFVALSDGGPLSGASSGWMRPDGKPVATSSLALSIGQVLYPPALDETGARVADGARAFNDVIANLRPRTVGGRCHDFSLQSFERIGFGYPNAGTAEWITAGELRCDEPAHFYCWSRAAGNDPPVAEADGLLAFVSEARLPAGAGIAAADALCELEGDAVSPGTYVALFAAEGRPAVARITGDGRQWVRVDGVVVASRADLDAGRLQAPISLTGKGTYLGQPIDAPEAWLGADNLLDPPAGGNCADLTATSGSGVVALVSSSRTRTASCDRPRRLRCVQLP